MSSCEQVSGCRICPNLARSSATRNDRTDKRILECPRQGPWCHWYTNGNFIFSNPFDFLQITLQSAAFECCPHVIWGKADPSVIFSGKQTAGKWDPSQNPELVTLGMRKVELFGSSLQTIVYHLQDLGPDHPGL